MFCLFNLSSLLKLFYINKNITINYSSLQFIRNMTKITIVMLDVIRP